MLSASLMLLAIAPTIREVDAFSPHVQHVAPICSSSSRSRVSTHPPLQTQLNARGEGFNLDDDDNDDDDRDFVYAGRRSGRGREEGGYDQQASSATSKRYQDNVEFFDLDDDDDEDDLFDDADFDRKSEMFEETYNGIIPNPLLDAMDPDGVYERLGPELFKDPTFFRDMALFAVFLAFFSGDTHHYGTFDSVVEGMERIPADFIPH
eukprot:224188_1